MLDNRKYTKIKIDIRLDNDHVDVIVVDSKQKEVNWRLRNLVKRFGSAKDGENSNELTKKDKRYEGINLEEMATKTDK